MRTTTLVLGAALCHLSGCVAYNNDCPVDLSPVVGRTEVSLDLRHTFLRTAEAPVGNLVADALFSFTAGLGTALAVVNAGAISDRSGCGLTDVIDRGPVRLGRLAELLPFDNEVAQVEISGRDLRRLLERSVAHLTDPGEAGLSGQFLQVSHLRFSADCTKPAAEGDQVGQRVTNIEIGDPGTGLAPVADDQRYLVATNSFLAAGGDGYSWLTNRHPLADAPADFVVVANYISAQTDRSVAPAVDGRIELAPSCTTTPP
ncbi:MAG: 5'-nucleotidase C-terminal domain-containing protein [Deltaproteobacteria bacterium]|nr:5'-nucleotidase C-terminal domain-containing protein [Deltaproteobacteria bacterium]